MGLFTAVKFTEPSNTKLYSFVKKLDGVEHAMRPQYYHATLIGSKDKDFDYRPSKELEGVKVEPVRWEIFGKDENKVLVLLLKADELDKRFQAIKKMGAETDWPDYRAHCTVACVDADFDLSRLKIPTFPMVVSHEYCTTFDANYKYEPKKMCEDYLPSFSEHLMFEGMFFGA